jgi:hypothetical protein
LGLAQATGTLILRTAGVRGAIYFREGRVIGARSRPHPRRIGALLRQSSAVDEAALAHAVGAQVGGDQRPLGEILLARGAVSAQALGSALAAQARGALASLLILPTGRFVFATRLLPPNGEHRLNGVDPRTLVFDALTRLDELAAGRHTDPPDRAPDS